MTVSSSSVAPISGPSVVARVTCFTPVQASQPGTLIRFTLSNCAVGERIAKNAAPITIPARDPSPPTTAMVSHTSAGSGKLNVFGETVVL